MVRRFRWFSARFEGKSRRFITIRVVVAAWGGIYPRYLWPGYPVLAALNKKPADRSNSARSCAPWISAG
jgi:hypothetical protein